MYKENILIVIKKVITDDKKSKEERNRVQLNFCDEKNISILNFSENLLLKYFAVNPKLHIN